MIRFSIFILLSISVTFAYDCVERYARMLKVDKYRLYAIYVVESGLNPYAINWKGKSYFFTDKRTASKFVMKLWKRGEKFDVGLGQISSENLKRWRINPLKALEPCFNVYLSAVVLSECIRLFGRNTKALDCYNKGKRAKPLSKYVLKVLRVYGRLRR